MDNVSVPCTKKEQNTVAFAWNNELGACRNKSILFDSETSFFPGFILVHAFLTVSLVISIGTKVTAILVKAGFYLGVELHREGSALAACAAGLFD